MDILEPKPMDGDRYHQLRCKVITGDPLPSDMVAELIADREFYRPRVEVTDADIRAAGLGSPDVCEEAARLLAWVAAQPDVHYIDSANDGRHGFWTGDPRVTVPVVRIIECSPMAHDHIINALAAAVGRSPLDVLAEIAATEVSDG